MRAYNRAEERDEAARIKKDEAPTNADLVAQYMSGMKHASRYPEA